MPKVSSRYAAEQFKGKLKRKFPLIKLLSPYKAAKKKVKLQCLKKECLNEWDATPDNLLNKVKFGCPQCAHNEANKEWKKSIRLWLSNNRKDVELIGELKTHASKTQFQCTRCKHIWFTTFRSLKTAKSGCPKCGIEKNRKARILPESVFRNWLQKNRPFIELISYESSSAKAKFKCLNPTCDTAGGKEWETLPEVLRLQKRGLDGCPDCGWKANGDNIRLPESVLRQWMEENRPTIIMGDNYRDTHSKTSFKCTTCSHEWDTSINSIRKNGAGCPKCAGNAPITKKEFINRLKKVSDDSIRLIGPWKGYGNKTLFKCQKKGCLHEWSIQPIRLTSSTPTGCPSCTATGFNHALPAWLYLMIKEDQQQFGITNDLPGRLEFHQRKGWKTQDYFGPAIGTKILEKESQLKLWLRKEIGLLIKGKEENWPINVFKVNKLHELFRLSKLQPLLDSDLIDLEEEFINNKFEIKANNDKYPFEWTELPKTKHEAWKLGSKKFFNGLKCRQGHISPRFVSGSCCECLRLSQLKISERNKKDRSEKIVKANEYRECPECKTTFLVTPMMRKDKVFCSSKCCASKSQRNYVLKNPELVNEQKKRSYEKIKKIRKNRYEF